MSFEVKKHHRILARHGDGSRIMIRDRMSGNYWIQYAVADGRKKMHSQDARRTLWEWLKDERTTVDMNVLPSTWAEFKK